MSDDTDLPFLHAPRPALGAPVRSRTFHGAARALAAESGCGRSVRRVE